MKRPNANSKQNDASVRMSLTSDDIKTLYLSNEKYIREVIDVCANMSERERLIILTLAKTLAIMALSQEEHLSPLVQKHRPNIRNNDHATYLHGVA